MMSTINKELYQALLEAKVSEEKAAAAAETDMKLPTELAEIKARLALVKKLQWVIIAGVIGLLLKAYILGA